MPRLSAPRWLIALFSLLSVGAMAASPASGRVHFLVQDADGQAFAGVTLRAQCQSSDGAFFGGKKLRSDWSCTSDAQGICTADIGLLALEGRERATPCEGSQATEVTEPGGSAHKSSYFTFFADGKAESFNLLQKGASWKLSDMLFKSLPSRAAFDALALRNTVAFYRQAISRQDDSAHSTTTLSSAPAHADAPKDQASSAYLQAHVDRKSRTATVLLVLSETYVDYTYHQLQSARVALGQETRTIPLQSHQQSTVCNLRDLMQRKCTYQERAQVALSLDDLRQVAASHLADPKAQWRFELLSQSGHQRLRSLPSAEFAAMGQAIDAALATPGQ